MKNKLKYNLPLLLLLCLFAVSGCELNFENKNAINPDNVWNEKKLISALLSDIYDIPGWPGSGSDESINGMGGNLDTYIRGILSVENNGHKINDVYGKINKINYFLENMENVSGEVMSETEKEQMIGQALFWRAWSYWKKVSQVGGVPLILKYPDIKDKESLFVPRNKTSECVTQIIKDLDTAIEYLPAKWDDDNYGRIDKGAVMAFKGRVLMWYASPLFNPTGEKSRWEEAYKANSDALTFLEGQGKGMYPDFKELWYDEQNNEVIMLNQYYYPDHTFDQSSIRPEPLSGAYNNNQPIYPLLSAFPKKDGSRLELDKERLKNDPEYNSQYFTDFLTDRDDRFFTSIYIGGTPYPVGHEERMDPEESYWCVWKKTPSDDAPDKYLYTSLAMTQLTRNAAFGISGFYQLKGLDKELDLTQLEKAKTDWVEIRFTEVLMNYGECANETGKMDEALEVLKKVRHRAGILAGNGMYGLTATGQDEIREAYVNERFVEFAYEGKRWGDLRRWKRFDILNKLKYRSGLYITLNDDKEINSRDDFDWKKSITDKAVRDEYFHLEFIENLDRSDDQQYNLSLEHWFFPIHREDLEKNSKLEQNNEWGGSFDPLQ